MKAVQPQTADPTLTIGLNPDGKAHVPDRTEIIQHITLRLAALGYWQATSPEDTALLRIASHLVSRVQEQSRLLSDRLSPINQRIQSFLDRHLAGINTPGPIRLPADAFVLDRFGLARELSLPFDADSVSNPVLTSYRLVNGVLHNPLHDRRTTKGVFHVAEGGLPVPADKRSVPKEVFARLLYAALNPPEEVLELPFTHGRPTPARLFCSLQLRPVVCPEAPGYSPEKRMEIHFFVPGSLVACLDFVESIFGNAGDPTLPENDAGLDVEHWTGHTGCIILAPHLTKLKKKDLGLPHYDDATERQRRDGMCWRDPDELYNDRSSFKVTFRTDEGVMVTLIADSYFGYCKKEVKTQISFAANLMGMAEEEHAGGALAIPSYALSDTFSMNAQTATASSRVFADTLACLGDRVELHEDGYAIDKRFRDILYLPEDAQFDLWAQRASWTRQGKERSVRLLPRYVYVLPSGYRVRMEKHPTAPNWTLIGTVAEGTFCHKPSTVSGGGKSEISKSIADAVLYGPVYVNDVRRDLDMVQSIIDRDYSDRYRPELRVKFNADRLGRPLLDPARSLGSVIKMLTPSPKEFTDEYNEWLATIPNDIKALVFIIKRMYRPEWGANWREHFSVDRVNGSPGHELKYERRKLVGAYLRVGLTADGSWRTHKLRQDFRPAEKVQMEDDITASVVVPARRVLGLPLGMRNGRSVKLVANCEHRLFQRPDDAIVRGYDKQTESDMAQPGLFCSNYEPLSPQAVAEEVADSIHFSQYTAPMQEYLRKGAELSKGYLVTPARPRLVEGKPSKNPRYLQVRPDLAWPRKLYLAEVCARLARRLPPDSPVTFPVHAVLAGRRNNPADLQAGIRPLAVYNPIHYQELPELFMDFICSLTGKSPSTTGAGSEGALTKGPFNALRPTADLNNALVSFILTGHAGFTTAAGHIGPDRQVDHDISLLVPEIWSRLTPAERDPAFLIRAGHLEKLEDMVHKGRPILASRLGYRITSTFVHTFLGRIFDNPMAVFTETMLRPETQDLDMFCDGVCNIVEAQQRVAQSYFDDGSIEEACPPLRALLDIMAHGDHNGADVNDPHIRQMFTTEYLLSSDWYQERLAMQQSRDIALWRRHTAYLRAFLARGSHAEEAERLGIAERLQHAEEMLLRVSGREYLNTLHGTIGADPLGATLPTATVLPFAAAGGR